MPQAQNGQALCGVFPEFIKRGIAAKLLDERLAKFDLARLGKSWTPQRDLKFGYLGLQTLYDRYFLHDHGQRIELPQASSCEWPWDWR